MTIQPLLEADIHSTVEALFEVDLYPTQEEIVETIAYEKNNRIILNTYTRYGKCGQFDIPTPTGEIKKIEDIEIGDKVLSLNQDTQEIVENQVTDKVDNGTKPVYELTTKSGRKVKTTEIHPYLTSEGWVKLEELEPGDTIAVPNQVPVEGDTPLPDYKVKYLAILLADGSCTAPNNFTFTNSKQELADDLDKDLPSKYKIRTYKHEGKAPKHSVRLKAEAGKRYNEHKLNHWLKEIGMKKKSRDKTVPDPVFRLPNNQLALFLNRYFDCDGWAAMSGGNPEIGVNSASRKLVQQIQHLLLRFGILSNVYQRTSQHKGQDYTSHQLHVSGKENVLKFAEEIGLFTKQENLDKVVEKYQEIDSNDSNHSVPKELFPEDYFKQYSKHYSGDYWINLQSDNVGLSTLQKINDNYNDELVKKHLHGDVRWEEIKDVEYLYDGKVYDIQVEEDHNFIANDVFAHNTFSVGIGLALLILRRCDEDLRIGILGPTKSDALNVRKEMLKAGLNNPLFKELVDTGAGRSADDLLKKAKQDELTFNDGKVDLKCLSTKSAAAHGDGMGAGAGSGLMGEGFDIIVLEESSQVNHEVWKKYGSRLLEEENSILIELGNPWRKDNQFFQHWTRNDFTCFKVSEEKGIKEGRHPKAWFDDKAEELGGRDNLEYKVLYKSEFPDEIESGLTRYSWVKKSMENDFGFETKPKTVYGFDVAGTGKDEAVLIKVLKTGERYRVARVWSRKYAKDTMELTGWVLNKVKDKDSKINVDAIGIGEGVADRMRERGYNAEKIKVGESPSRGKDRFTNKKARYYWKLRNVFESGDISLPEDTPGKLIKELTHITYEFNSREKISIKDPGTGSPDYADCYDDKTEIMTKKGWKKFDEVSYSDEIATLNPENKELEYQRPTNIIEKDYRGKLYHVTDSDQIDVAVTPNHKLYVNTGDRRYGDFELEKAENVKNKQMTWKKDCIWNGEYREKFVVPGISTSPFHEWRDLDKPVEVEMENWLKFLGYFLSEGYVSRNNRNVVILACSKDSDIRNEMKNCLDKLPFKATERDVGFALHDKRIHDYLERFGKAESKYIPLKIKELESDQLEILFQALMDGDGSRNQYYTVSKRLRDDVMELALKTGRSANWTVKYEEGAEGNYGTANHDLYTVQIQEKNTNPEINYKDYGAKDEWIDYEGKIYCVTVPNHIIMVRRNGKTCWSGNSLMLALANVNTESELVGGLSLGKRKPGRNYI